MSYSRWSNSRWYTFWHATSQPENHNNAKFTVSDSIESEQSFAAAEIRKNVDACVGKFTGTTEELAELRGYMLDFLRDVDERYPR